MAFSHNPKITSSGLRLYIDPADLNSHGSGTELNDLSGNGWTDNIGGSSEITFTGNPTHISDTGAGGYFYYTNSSYTDWATTDFSISAWGNRDNYTSDAQGRFCDLLYAGNGHLRLTLKGAPILQFRPTGGGGNTLISGGSTTAGNWYNVVVTKSGTTSGGSADYVLYVNGEQVATNTSTALVTDANFQRINVLISSDDDNSSITWDGLFGPLSIYTKVLTPLEVKNNFNALRKRFNI